MKTASSTVAFLALSLLHFTVAAQVAPATGPAVDTTELGSKAVTPLAPQREDGGPWLIDNIPRFRGGEVALRLFLRQHLRYPPALLRAHVEGKTGVRFIVDTNGRIQDAVVQKSLCQPWDDEVMRVVNLLAYRFEPATYYGLPVAAPYYLVVPLSIK